MNLDSTQILNEIIGGCFHPQLFQEVKMNIKELNYFFNNKQPIYGLLLDLISKYEYDKLTPDFIKLSILEKSTLSSSQIDHLISIIRDKRSIENGPHLDTIKNNIKKVCYLGVLSNAQKFASEDPEKYTKLISEYNYKEITFDFFKLQDITKLDPKLVAEKYLNNPIHSSIDMINYSYSTKRGYLRGSLVQVVGAPKKGKSMFLMQEASHFAITQGLKVHYLAIGDLNESDFMARISSIVTHTNLEITYSNISITYDKFLECMEKSGGQIVLTVMPALELTPENYATIAKMLLSEFDVLIIDYDYNFKNDNSNMYERGGEIYNLLAKVKTYNNQLILVASQPSKSWWNESFLDETCGGESSMKQMIVDTMITIGAFKESGTPCGYINIPIQRRGTSNYTGYIRCDDGSINEVPELLLAEFQNDRRKRSISHNELGLLLSKNGE